MYGETPPERTWMGPPTVWLIYLAGIPVNAWLSRSSHWGWAISLAGTLVFLPLYFLGYRVGQARAAGDRRQYDRAGWGDCTVEPGSGRLLHLRRRLRRLGRRHPVHRCMPARARGGAGGRDARPAAHALLLGAGGHLPAAHRRHQHELDAAAAGAAAVAASTGRSGAHRQGGRARAHRPRLARCAGAHIVRRRAQVGAGFEAGRDRSRARRGGDSRRGADRAPSPGGGAQHGAGLCGAQLPGRAGASPRGAASGRRGGEVRGRRERDPSRPRGRAGLHLARGRHQRHPPRARYDLHVASQELHAGRCRLEIRDNGCGHPGSEGVGLAGIRSRVEALGGHFQRETGAGTALIITLPVPAS